VDVVLARSVSLLIIAMLVAIIARRSKLPYTVGLVITGLVLALLPIKTGFALTHDLIFLVILPPLLFEAALNIPWEELRRDLPPVLSLTIFGVVISAVTVAGGMIFLANWPTQSALVFGILIAATDPVAVIAMFKDSGLSGRLRLLVESESLFNDGVAAVLFGIVLTWTQGDILSPMQATQALALSAGGGFAIGLICGGTAIIITGHTADHLVETTLSALAAYGSFLLAEHFHGSGVLATVAAGLLMGNLKTAHESRRPWLSLHGEEFLIEFWDFAAFIANSMVFLLIGLAVAGQPFDRTSSMTIIAAVLSVLVGRFLSVYPVCWLFRRSAWAVPLREQHVLWWGGLRGALGLALALSLPQSLPLHNEIVLTTFGVAVFSIVVQGLSMPQLLRSLGLPHAPR
jgi:CPA1 family monovalent cation:H+ antiporter